MIASLSELTQIIVQRDEILPLNSSSPERIVGANLASSQNKLSSLIVNSSDCENGAVK